MDYAYFKIKLHSAVRFKRKNTEGEKVGKVSPEKLKERILARAAKNRPQVIQLWKNTFDGIHLENDGSFLEDMSTGNEQNGYEYPSESQTESILRLDNPKRWERGYPERWERAVPEQWTQVRIL